VNGGLSDIRPVAALERSFHPELISHFLWEEKDEIASRFDRTI
jgi:hypothetical protein